MFADRLGMIHPMTTATDTRRRRDSRAAKRAAARRAADARAGRFATGAHAAATAATVATVPTDVRHAADGSRAVRKRDTSRRAIAITDGALPGSMPVNVDADGQRVTDARKGYAAADARRWRGEARSTRPTPAATDAKLYVTIANGNVPRNR